MSELMPRTAPRRSAALFVCLLVLVQSAVALAVNPNSATTTTDQELKVTLTVTPSANPVWVGTTVSAGAVATLGEGDFANIIYTVDLSGSMENSGFNPFEDINPPAGIGPEDDCNGDGVRGSAMDAACFGLIALNGSLDSAENVDIGMVGFGSSSKTADMGPAAGSQTFTSPPDADDNSNAIADVVEVTRSMDTEFGGPSAIGGFGLFTLDKTASFPGGTNYNAGLSATNASLAAEPPGEIDVVFFLSDGSPTAGTFTTGPGSPLAVAAAAGTKIHTFGLGAIAPGSCAAGSPLRTIADTTGGTCTEVSSPSTLATVLPATLTKLTSLTLKVNAATVASVSGVEPVSMTIPATDITASLVVGTNTIAATGVAQDGTTVTADQTLGVIRLTLAPPTATNELSVDNTHSVTATVQGPAGSVGGLQITFAVTGQNAGATGVCSPNPACLTNASGVVSFTYSVPQVPASLGTDTITATGQTIAGVTPSVQVTKTWDDTTGPLASCSETVNPHGTKIPPAGSTTLPGAKGGQNEDGFYALTATDDLYPSASLQLYVKDTGSGTVFGPFTNGTRIKYTESGATPGQKAMGSGSGQAGAVAWHINGTGDAVTYAVDPADNQSAETTCLVPPPPK